MATSNFWQRTSTSPPQSSPEWSESAAVGQQRTARGSVGMWMFLDAVTVFGAALVACVTQLHAGPIDSARSFLHGNLIAGQSTGILTGLLAGFTVTLIFISRKLQLYHPVRLTNHLHEQRHGRAAVCG